jgi:hypothetical protein
MLFLSRFFFVLAIFFSVFFHALKRYAVIGTILIIAVTAIAALSGGNVMVAFLASLCVAVVIAFVASLTAINKPW